MGELHQTEAALLADAPAEEQVVPAPAEDTAAVASTEGSVAETTAERGTEVRPKSGFRYGCYRVCKRVFDMLSSLSLLLVLSPLILICLFVKWVEDAIHPKYELTIEPADVTQKPGKRTTRITRADGAVLDCRLIPVKLAKGEKRFSSPIYISERVGKNGRHFSMWKIRSMIPNAAAMKQQLIDAGLNESDPPAFKMKKDPRITPFGRFLRKLSIDELGQLINIFVGNMSVIGPRPPLPREVEQYNETQMHRLDVKGGLLCLWQVQKNRNALTFDEWCRLDFRYIEKQSVWLDLAILFRGAYMVLFDHSGE